MSDRSIEVDRTGGFRPYEAVSGRVRGGRIEGEVRLFWVTVGRGTEELGVVDSAKLDATGTFVLQLPAAPYSFSGSLVGVEWSIEWVDDSGDAIDQCRLVVSPTGERIDLGKVDKPRSDKAKRRKGFGRLRGHA